MHCWMLDMCIVEFVKFFNQYQSFDTRGKFEYTEYR